MEKMSLVALVFVGSGLGGVARYVSGLWITRWAASGFPFSTLFVNVLGSLVIGILASLTKSGDSWLSQPGTQALLVIGLCGGFTTFSSFSLQTLELIQAEKFLSALINIIANCVLCLVFTWIGYMAGQLLRNN